MLAIVPVHIRAEAENQAKNYTVDRKLCVHNWSEFDVLMWLCALKTRKVPA